MPGKNNKEEFEEVTTEVPELPEEGVPEGLEDFDPEGLIEPSPEDIMKEEIEKLKSIKGKIIDALTVNQKYIKRNFERIQELEDNFKILLEKLK